MISKQDYEILQSHINTIKTIVINQSCSVMSAQFRNDIRTLANRYGISYCSSCNSQIYKAVKQLYNYYIEYEKKLNKNVQRGEDTKIQGGTPKGRRKKESEINSTSGVSVNGQESEGRSVSESTQSNE